MEMSPAEQAVWLYSCFLGRTVAFQLCLASSGESGTTCLQGREGRKQTLHGVREAPGLPQLRIH